MNGPKVYISSRKKSDDRFFMITIDNLGSSSPSLFLTPTNKSVTLASMNMISNSSRVYRCPFSRMGEKLTYRGTMKTYRIKTISITLLKCILKKFFGVMINFDGT